VSALFHSRRRATAVVVPSALAIAVAGAFVAAPALAASPAASPTLPFPTVCPSGSAIGVTPSVSPSTPGSPTPSASGTPTPTPTGTATPGAAAKKVPATPSPSRSTAPAPTSSAGGGAPASPTPSATSSSPGGFWGWLNGVWTWIVSDAPYTGTNTGAVAAAAPLGEHGAVVDANAPLGDRGGVVVEDAADSDASADPSPTGTSPSCVTEPAGGPTSAEGVYAVTTPWVMKTPSMTLTGLTFNGVETVKVYSGSAKGYVDEPVLDFTAAQLTIRSMVTYSIQPGVDPGSENTVYNNAGSGTITTLTNVHMMTVSLKASLYGLIPQDYTPTDLPPLPEHLDLGPIPVVFTDATVQLAFLNTGSIDVPGFDGVATPGAASPQ